MPTQEDINNAQMLQNLFEEQQANQAAIPQANPAIPAQLQMAIEGKYLQGIQQQKQNIAETEKELAGITKRKAQLDLSPLAALMDSWTGSNLAPYAKPKFSEEDKTTLLKSYRQLLSNQKQELTQAELALLKTKGNAMLAGGKTKELSQPTIMKLNEANIIPNTLDKLSTEIDDRQALFGPVKGRSGQWNPYDIEAQSFDAKIRAASQQFGRYMEGGVLRKEDEEKYRKMFPNLADTPEVAKNKLSTVRELLENKRTSDFQAFEAQGYNLAGINKQDNKAKKTREEMIAEIQKVMSPEEMKAVLAGQ